MNQPFKHKLAEAVPQPGTNDAKSVGVPADSPRTISEQAREAEEGRGAEIARVGQRDLLVDIGKAHHMAGRGNGRRSDS